RHAVGERDGARVGEERAQCTVEVAEQQHVPRAAARRDLLRELCDRRHRLDGKFHHEATAMRRCSRLSRIPDAQTKMSWPATTWRMRRILARCSSSGISMARSIARTKPSES